MSKAVIATMVMMLSWTVFVYPIQAQTSTPTTLDSPNADNCESLLDNNSTAEDFYNAGIDRILDQNYEVATQYLACAIELDQFSAEAYRERGVAYDYQGNYGLAVADYTQAITLGYQPLSQAYYDRAIAYEAIGDLRRAVADLNRAIDLDADWAFPYWARANIEAEQGNLTEAIIDYNTALELDPALGDLYAARGIVYAAQGNNDRAVDDFSQALELNPQFTSAYIWRGVVYVRLGDYDIAIADFSSALALEPENALVYYYRGRAYALNGNHRKAIADYSQAIEIDPQYDYYVDRGLAYVALDFPLGVLLATFDFTRASELAPTSAQAYYSLGLAFDAAESYDDAIEQFNTAIERDPEYPQPYGMLGTIYVELGREEEALEYYHQYLELAGVNADLSIVEVVEQLEAI